MNQINARTATNSLRLCFVQATQSFLHWVGIATPLKMQGSEWNLLYCSNKRLSRIRGSQTHIYGAYGKGIEGCMRENKKCQVVMHTQRAVNKSKQSVSVAYIRDYAARTRINTLVFYSTNVSSPPYYCIRRVYCTVAWNTVPTLGSGRNRVESKDDDNDNCNQIRKPCWIDRLFPLSMTLKGLNQSLGDSWSGIKTSSL